MSLGREAPLPWAVNVGDGIFHSSPDVGTYIKYLPTHSRKLQRYLGVGSVSHGNGLTITRVPISGCYSTYQWKYVGMVRLTSSIAELVCEYFRVYTRVQRLVSEHMQVPLQ